MRIRGLMAAAATAFALSAFSGEASALQMESGCAIEVATMEEESRREYITGMGVLADVNSSRRPQSFAELSCLERLMNSVMDVFFEPPGLPDLLGALENFICDKANEVFNEVSGHMAHSFDESLPIGEIVPGVNLGSMRGSMRVRVRQGAGGSSQDVNLSEIFGENYPQTVRVRSPGLKGIFE